MRDTLIVLNYQREIPPFMQSILHFADEIFDKVIYITPELYNDNRSACRAPSLKVYQVPRSRWRKSFLKLPAAMLRCDTREQIKIAKLNNVLDTGFIKNLIVYAVCPEVLYFGFQEVLQRESIDTKRCVVLSAWFDVSAYAATKIKENYSDIFVASYAHAFEVKKEVNPFALYTYNVTKHTYCDEIVFISKTIKDNYFLQIESIYNKKISENNINVRYLGSEKAFFNAINKRSEDGVLRLVSCSGAVAGKRIHLIIEALAKWDGNQIHWTHLGGGPLLTELQEQAHTLLGKKENVSFAFKGQLENRQVQEYYATQPIDLFINVSESEGLPVSLMECMSYGIPAIATDVGGNREIVTEKTGFLLDKEFSSEDLCKVIRKYIDFPDTIKDSYRRAAYSLWNEAFNGEKNARDFLTYLSKK